MKQRSITVGKGKWLPPVVNVSAEMLATENARLRELLVRARHVAVLLGREYNYEVGDFFNEDTHHAALEALKLIADIDAALGADAGEDGE